MAQKIQISIFLVDKLLHLKKYIKAFKKVFDNFFFQILRKNVQGWYFFCLTENFSADYHISEVKIMVDGYDQSNFTFYPFRLICYYRNDRSLFSWTNVKDFLSDTLKTLEIVKTAFNKQIPHFLTDDNLITTLCSVYIWLHQSAAYLWIDIAIPKNQI